MKIYDSPETANFELLIEWASDQTYPVSKTFEIGNITAVKESTYFTIQHKYLKQSSKIKLYKINLVYRKIQ